MGKAHALGKVECGQGQATDSWVAGQRQQGSAGRQRSARQCGIQHNVPQRSSPRVPPLLEVAVGEADGDGASAGLLYRHLAVGEGE